MKKLLFISIFSYAAFSGLLASAQGSHAIHFGFQFGNFYEEKVTNAEYFGLHSGSAPIIAGYDYYVTPNYGFRFTGYYSGFGIFGFVDPITLQNENQTIIRNTNVLGLKYSTKYWVKDVTESKYNIGFEAGIGAMRHKFTTNYSFNSFGLTEEPIEIELSKILIPVNLGVSAVIGTYSEIGVSYNFYPSLGDINEPFTNPNSSLTYQNPQMKKGFTTLTFRYFIPFG